MPFVAATRSLGRAGLFSLSVFRASAPTRDFFAELTREMTTAAEQGRHAETVLSAAIDALGQLFLMARWGT